MAHDYQTIAKLAYHLWEARGRQGGSSEDDWREAEQQLTAKSGSSVDEASKESFPASDAPANHLPDVPPANSADKWAAAAGDAAPASGKAIATPRKRSTAKPAAPKSAATAKPVATPKPAAPAKPTTASKPLNPRGSSR